MAENTINVKVKQRTDTESNWASKNPVLLKGEMAISSDKNNKYKIGDGTSVWSALSYAKADLSKSDVTTALGYTPPTTNHTHNYAGSSSVGGAANSAVKLATARTVSNTEDFVMSFSYDGSANSNANLRYYNSCISVGGTNNYPYHRFAKIDTQTGSYIDKSSTFLITQDYNNGGWGIIRISLRTNSSSVVSVVEAKWLVRCGLNVDCVQIGLYNVFGKTYADAFFKTSGALAGTVIRNLASGARGGIARTWTLIDSTEADNTTTSDKKTSTESYASTSTAATTLHSQAYTSVVVATDGGTVSYANSAGNASKVNNHTVNADVPSGAKFTDTNTWRPLGTTADTACAGNDSRLSNARPANGGTATYANYVYATSHQGSWYQNSQWDGTYFQTNYKNGDNVLPMKVGYAGYADSAGSANSVAWSNVSGRPSSLPANGGNSTTVNGHTVNSNVPANAKFTDTTYAIATTSANGLMSKDMVTKLNGIASGATAVTSTTVSNWGFKKTDTWRGVQNNLTSTATDQSLSAYQGKVLKDLVDKKTTFTYSSTQPTSPASNAVWIG